MGDKGVESAVKKARETHFSHQIADGVASGRTRETHFSNQIADGVGFRGLLGFRNHGRPDVGSKTNLNPIWVLTESVGSLIGLRFVALGDTVRTICLQTSCSGPRFPRKPLECSRRLSLTPPRPVGAALVAPNFLVSLLSRLELEAKSACRNPFGWQFFFAPFFCGCNFSLHLFFGPVSFRPIFYSTLCRAPPRSAEKILLLKKSRGTGPKGAQPFWPLFVSTLGICGGQGG